jgi:hypothetical protein
MESQFLFRAESGTASDGMEPQFLYVYAGLVRTNEPIEFDLTFRRVHGVFMGEGDEQKNRETCIMVHTQTTSLSATSLLPPPSPPFVPPSPSHLQIDIHICHFVGPSLGIAYSCTSHALLLLLVCESAPTCFVCVAAGLDALEL